jgi:hypothetical protein
VRVAGGVDVALRAVELRRHLELADEVGGGEVARLPGCTLALPDCCSSSGSQPISSSAPVQATRSALRARAIRLGLAWIWCGSWSAVGRDRDVDEVAADLLRERAPLGLAREDAKRGVRGGEGDRRAAPRRAPASDGGKTMHGVLLGINTSARRARPRLIWYCTNHCVSAPPSRARSRATCNRTRENSLGLKSTISESLRERSVGHAISAVFAPVVGRSRIEPSTRAPTRQRGMNW